MKHLGEQDGRVIMTWKIVAGLEWGATWGTNATLRVEYSGPRLFGLGTIIWAASQCSCSVYALSRAFKVEVHRGIAGKMMHQKLLASIPNEYRLTSQTEGFMQDQMSFECCQHMHWNGCDIPGHWKRFLPLSPTVMISRELASSDFSRRPWTTPHSDLDDIPARSKSDISYRAGWPVQFPFERGCPCGNEE